MEYLLSQVYQLENFFSLARQAEEDLFRVDRVNDLHREMTPLKCTDVPEVLAVHAISSVEVSMSVPLVRSGLVHLG